MHGDVQDCLRAILPEALRCAGSLPLDEVSFLVWTRESSGWLGSWEARSALPIWVPERGYLCPEDLARRFGEVMSRHHPEHLGMVGTAGSLLRLDARLLLDRLIREVWSRHAACVKWAWDTGWSAQASGMTP